MGLASSLRRLLPLLTVGLAACGGGASAAATDPLPPNPELAPSFAVTSNGRDLDVNAVLFAHGAGQTLPAGDQLVAVSGNTRTPLTVVVGSEIVAYGAKLPAATTEENVSIVLQRVSGDAPASSVTLPAPFEVVDIPASAKPGAEISVTLSRALGDREKLELTLAGCGLQHALPAQQRAATRYSFVLDKSAPVAQCTAVLNVRIRREGTLDDSFARSFVYGDAGAVEQPASFVGIQDRRANLVLVAP